MAKYQAPVEKKDGGFYFSDYDVHVVASDVSEAKKIIKNTHGLDLDVDPRPVVEEDVKKKKTEKVENDE